MSFSERILTVIKELTDQGIRKYEIAEAAGLSKGIVTHWESNEITSIKPEVAQKLEEKYGYNHRWLMLGEPPKFIKDKKENFEISPDEKWFPVKIVGTKLTAGISGFAIDYIDEEAEPLFFRASWFQKRQLNPSKLFAFIVKGESMRPTIEPGGVVVVDTNNTHILDNHMYAINYHGETVIKRITFDMGRHWLTSDNNSGAYPRVAIDEETIIIGRVVKYETDY